VPKFPEPPSAAELAANHAPDIAILPQGSELWRIYYRGGDHPTRWNEFRSFGPSNSRFDHHIPPAHVQSRAILYATRNPKTCLAEVYQETHLIDRSRNKPWLAGFKLHRDVALLDLSGTWPTRAGASMAINSGPRPRARRWSRAIYDGYLGLIEGLLYPSSMNANEPAIAFYEPANPCLPKAPTFHRPLDDPNLDPYLRSAAHGLGYRLS